VILAGDVGGTHTRLALFTAEGGTLRPVVEETFPSREHADLGALAGRCGSRRPSHRNYGGCRPLDWSRRCSEAAPNASRHYPFSK
jgi:hypothetical protein